MTNKSVWIATITGGQSDNQYEIFKTEEMALAHAAKEIYIELRENDDVEPDILQDLGELILAKKWKESIDFYDDNFGGDVMLPIVEILEKNILTEQIHPDPLKDVLMDRGEAREEERN